MPKAYNPNDVYFRKAKERGFRARSAFKLEEILQKFPRILSAPANVLDLGSFPGSFLQVLGDRNLGGSICGVDLSVVQPFPKSFPANLHLIQGDAFEESTAQEILDFFGDKKADLITSDMAPKTSGIKSVDQWKSIELNQRVLELCELLLRPKKGVLVSKIFKGEDFEEFWVDEFRDCFEKVKTFKPKSCRDRSVEVFLIGIGWIGKNTKEGRG